MQIVKQIFVIVLLSLGYAAHGQKQLIVLKGEDVLLRLFPGDEFIYKLKGNKSVVTTYVNNISDTAVVTHRDTIPYYKIDRIYFKQHKLHNTVGTALVIFGGGLFLIDQVNLVLVNGQSPDLDDRVSVLSLSALGAGLPLMLLKKKSQKLDHRHRLRMVDKQSVFYRPDTRQPVDN